MPNLPFSQYLLKDKAYGSLNAAITSTATSLAVKSGQGTKFPASDYVIKIEDEAIYVSSRTTDTFNTLTRGYF